MKKVWRDSIGVVLFGCLLLLNVWTAAAQNPTATTTTKDTKKTRKKAEETVSSAAKPATTTTAPATDSKAKKTAPTPTKTAADAEIQAARASGKVWVNTETGVYHKGGQWYGATKKGKFMTEQEATKAGYHAAKSK